MLMLAKEGKKFDHKIGQVIAALTLGPVTRSKITATTGVEHPLCYRILLLLYGH